MNKIDEILKDIRIADIEPDENLVRLTKLECKKTVREDKKTADTASVKRGRLMVRTLAAAAFVAVVFLALVVSSARTISLREGSAYYTIDINPSFGFTVDEENVVIDVSLLNADAKELYEGMDCEGMQLQEAIKLIIKVAKAEGYMSAAKENYVLLGQFMKDGSDKDRQEILEYLLESLRRDIGDGVKIIGVSGNERDIDRAKELEVSPGILILCEIAGDEADGEVEIDEVAKHLPDEYYGEPEFVAPKIEAYAQGDELIIKWNEIDFSKVASPEAQVEYKLLKGSTLEEISNMKNIVKTQKVSISDEQPVRLVLNMADEQMNAKTYYCLYVYCSSTAKLSNVVPVTFQSAEPTKEPEATAQPIGEEGASQISGSILDDKIKLEWTKIESERFDGYKVMYSSVDSTPVYGEEGCYYLEYVTDPNKITETYRLSSLKGYEQGKKYYFSITVLYDGHETKVPGNVISKVMPTTTPNVTPTPPPADEYPSTNISGRVDGDYIVLNWSKISDERLEGYKVVYSFTDSTPEYSSSSYLRWITNASTTSTVISMSELGESSEERTCYFSITALYKDGSRRPGNAVHFTIPPMEVPDYVSSTLYSATYNADTKKITLVWSPVEHPQFEGYKVMYSPSDSSPVYGDGSPYMAWITNATSTSYTVYAPNLDGYGPGETLYFSISVLYDSHSVIKGGDTKTVTFPIEVTPTPVPTATPVPSYPAANVSSVTESLVTWSTVSHEDFYCYKVKYSFTDDSGSGVIEEIYDSTASIADYYPEGLDGYAPGKTCEFYVVTVYYNGVDDFTKTGSSKAITFS